MANHRILTAAVAAALTGSLLLNGWAMEVKAPAGIANLGVGVPPAAQASPISMPEPLALPASAIEAPASAEISPEVQAQSPLSAQAELGLAAARINQAAALGHVGREGQVSEKLFDAKSDQGNADDSSQDGASSAAQDAPHPIHLPDKAHYVVVPEVVFPEATRVVPVEPGQEDRIRKLSVESGGLVVCVTDRPASDGGPAQRGHSPIGTLAKMEIREGEGGLRVAYTGIVEAKIEKYRDDVPVAEVSYPKLARDARWESFQIRRIGRYQLAISGDGDMLARLMSRYSETPVAAVSKLLQETDMGLEKDQELLYSLSLPARLAEVANHYSQFVKDMDIKMDSDPQTPEEEAVDFKIEQGVQETLEKAQEKILLETKLDAIKKMLNGGKDADPALKAVEEKFARKKDQMSVEAREAVELELRKANRMSPSSPDYQISINYLEWLTGMPWGEMTKDTTDIKRAAEVLDADHYGIADVKDRIVEFLAVRKALAALSGADENPEEKSKGKVLAFDGPPGVGKTSVAKSIAKAMGRKFIRISLAGLHDEAELRGHRRTYIGAMPGRIIQAMRKAGVTNPVILLDEVEKVGSNNGEPGRRGNAENALVELLDPDQNRAWHDNYLDVDYDLSNVLFIGTSNDLRQLSQPVRDRLEVVSFSSYIEEEKMEIAARHLIRKQLKENGFAPGAVTFTNDAVEAIIRGYTQEGGVRNLEREIGAILRKMQKRIQEGAETPKVIDVAVVKDYLGSPKIVDKHFKNDVGVVAGLYWSEGGGGVLRIETGTTPKGSTDKHLSVTGNIKEIMQESSQIAYRNAMDWAINHGGVDPAVFTTHDFDIHVPEGATPKDGPSAGISMTTALVSLVTGRRIKQGYAMTGEISRRGFVMPIGGLKEKALGALRMGYTDIIIPKDNEKDLEDIPASARAKLNFHSVERIEEVLKLALEESGAPMKPAVVGKSHSASEASE